MSRIGKPIEIEHRLVVARGWGGGAYGSDCLRDVGFPSGVTKMSGDSTELMVAQNCEDTKCH